jgi:hypothetical protein
MLSVEKSKWVYFLPALHAGLEILNFLTPHGVIELFGFPILLLADFPLSIVVFTLAWKYPLLAHLWILVVGTAWWYFLSRLILKMLSKFGDRQPPSLLT